MDNNFKTTIPAGGTEPRYSNGSPRIGGAFQAGWDKLWSRFPVILLTILIFFVVNLAIQGIQLLFGSGDSFGENLYSMAFGLILSILVTGPLSFGLANFYMKVVRGDSVSVPNLFDSFTNYGHVMLAVLLKSLIIGVGTIFFIVPGVIFSCKLAFVEFLVVDRKMSAIQAIEASWELTRGYAGRIFLMYLLFIPISLAGLLVFVIGLVPAMMWTGLTIGAFYLMVLKQREPAPEAIIEEGSGCIEEASHKQE